MSAVRRWVWDYNLKHLGSWPGNEYKGHNKPVEVVEAAAYEAVCEQLRLANIDQANTEAKLNDAKRDLATVQGERDALRTAIELIRDAVLHGRGPLAEMEVDSDITNAVLGIIDDETPQAALAQPAAPSEVCQHASTRWVRGMYEKTQECCTCGAELDERKL